MGAARRCSGAANQRSGVYDPILNRWQVLPSSHEEHDEQMRLRAHGLIATKRKVPQSPNVGEYDPIRWAHNTHCFHKLSTEAVRAAVHFVGFMDAFINAVPVHAAVVVDDEVVSYSVSSATCIRTTETVCCTQHMQTMSEITGSKAYMQVCIHM